jgi:hypothetical protein
MKHLLLFLISFQAVLHKNQKADKQILQNLKSHVEFLADDKLEGRRAGSSGEKLASDYISDQFTRAGLTPKGINGTFLQPFDISEGKQVLKTTFFNVNQHELVLGKEYFPLAYSPSCMF